MAGPLVEPGWPDLRGGPDISAKFLTGFQVGSQVNARKQALENQLAMMSLREKQLELNQANKEAMYNLAVEKLGLQAQRNAAYTENLIQDNALQAKKFEIKDYEMQKAQEAQSGLVEAKATLEAEGLHPGDKGYIARYNELTSPFIASLPKNIFNAEQKSIYGGHNNVVNERMNYYKMAKREFDYDLGSTLYGNALQTDPSPLLHMDQLTKEKTGSYFFGTQKESGNLVVVDPLKKTKKAVAAQDIINLKRRYDDLEKLRNQIAPKVDRPDLGVTDAHPIPSNGKAGLVPGTLYQTPSGKLIWDGNKFIQP